MLNTKKPAKPYPDFPLYFHASGQWVKKIRQKLHYFGTDADAALEKYTQQRDDLHAVRKPRITGDELTVRDLCNRFLTTKKRMLDGKELSPRTFLDYHGVCERIVEAFGKTRMVQDLAGDDFEVLRADLQKTRGPVSLGNEIQRIRTVFKYAFDETLIDKPVRFGTTFKKPTRKTVRKARQAAGSRMIEAADLRRMLDTAKPPMKAMILLGLNCGFGQTDVATLPVAAVDLERGVDRFPPAENRCGPALPALA